MSSIELDGTRVLVKFWLDKNIHVGDRSEARIRAKSLLGTKVLEVLPRGEDPLVGTIPIDRTTSPYQLPDALGDLATTIGGLNTVQLSESLATLAQTFSDTPEELKSAVQGVARFAQTLNERDANLRKLLENAAKATGVLAKRTDQVVSLVQGHQCAAGGTADAKRRVGSDLVQRLRGGAATQGIHRRKPTRTAAGSGQAQRRADDHRQSQGAPATGRQRAQHLCHVAW